MASIRTRPWRFPLALALAQSLASTTVPAAELGGERIVDLELVLAIDASSSVSGIEFDLQIQGLAEAFRHPSVARAIRAAGELGLTVALFQWAGNQQQVLEIDWTVVRDAPSASRFAKEVETVFRSIAGNTAIGSAVEFAIGQLDGNGFDGRRKVIDVSGDGPNNRGTAAWLARNLAVARGITVNGLAILNEDPRLDRYYVTNVIGGPGAFVMTANDYDAYRLAIVAKLIKEISGAPIAARPSRLGARLALAPR
jgi:hypothetical protein